MSKPKEKCDICGMTAPDLRKVWGLMMPRRAPMLGQCKQCMKLFCFPHGMQHLKNTACGNNPISKDILDKFREAVQKEEGEK